VYRRDLSSPTAVWESLGLTGVRLWSVFAYRVDDFRFFIFAGASPAFTLADTVLVYRWGSHDGRWIPCDSGMIRRSFGVIAMHGVAERRLLYAGGPGSIGDAVYKYEDGSWKTIYEGQAPHPLITSLYVDPQSEIVFAGGGTFIMAPFLARSTNKDRDWKRIPSADRWWFSGSVSDVVAAPDSARTIYVGTSGVLEVTRDDGVTWYTLLEEQGNFLSIAIDRVNPNRIYVGYDSLDNCKLLETIDKGKTWFVVRPLEQKKRITSMVLDPMKVGTLYVATRGDGVLRYQSMLVNVEGRSSMPNSFHLSQNYPNPFNSMTTIELHREGNNELVPLEIYDLLGRKIRTVIGSDINHRFHWYRWDGRDELGKDVPSGVYLYRAQIADQSRTRALMLLR